MGHILGSDIGGIFTDFALLDESSGVIRIHKRDLVDAGQPPIGELQRRRQPARRTRCLHVGFDQVDHLLGDGAVISLRLLAESALQLVGQVLDDRE